MKTNRIKGIDHFREFIQAEQAGGFILIGCTVISLFLANSYYSESYQHFWHLELGYEPLHLKKSITHWINDGLMALFFLLAGLEIKRECVEGELSSIRKSTLPIVAALGGMVVPAIIFYLINLRGPAQNGWGIPMATDIAFAIGIMGMLGKRVPLGLKVMLTALAIVDDLGAIIVIAIFYSANISVLNLLIAFGIWGGLITLNISGVRNIIVYIFLGLLLWYFTLQSGIHASIAGVLFALALPLGKGNKDSTAEKIQHFLEKPVAFLVIPLFALANTGFVLQSSFTEVLGSSEGIGIFAGLFIGKPLGIFLFSWLSIKLGMSGLPKGTTWTHLLGAGVLGGIGFTMSIFIALLAFDNEVLEANSKLAILIGSGISAIVGYLILRFRITKKQD